ncbi:MAG: UxaA family hydrolase [Butyricicoccus sp.]
MEKGLILVHDGDDAAVALADLKAGETYTVAGQTVTLRDDIPFGHKAALRAIKAGENVIKYGNPLGHATQDIQVGDHIHTHNMATNLDGHIEYTYQPDAAALAAFAERHGEATFEGYPRPDGKVGVRNELWVVPTVGCVNMTAQRLAEMAKAEFGAHFDDVRAYTHNMGCSQLGDDQATTMKLLSGLIHNPNAGGVLVLSLGCENNNLDVFRPYLGEVDETRVKFLVTQDVDDEYEAGMALLRELDKTVGCMQRQTVPASGLVVGFKCGGSDAFSGVTANPLCGRLCDRVVREGGSCVLTEVPEMFGAEHLLMARAVDEDTFGQTVNLINDYKDYFTRHGQVIYENPSPGNKAGGISTLEEKSLGCVQKGGSAPVVGVLGYGDPVEKNGLNLLTGSGNDQVSCTNLTCSGATIICFTTGRGNPFGAPVPTVKVASNSALAARKPHWIDFNAGQVLDGVSWEDAADAFFRYILDVASGRVRTRSEENGYKEISVFRDGVIL